MTGLVTELSEHYTHGITFIKQAVTACPRPYCYKSASDAAPNASDSTPKTIFWVFFAVRGSTLRFGFLFAVDFAVRRFAQKFAVRGSERTAKKSMVGAALGDAVGSAVVGAALGDAVGAAEVLDPEERLCILALWTDGGLEVD